MRKRKGQFKSPLWGRVGETGEKKGCISPRYKEHSPPCEQKENQPHDSGLKFEMNPNKKFWDSESITSRFLYYSWVPHITLLPCSGQPLPKYTGKAILTVLPGPGAGSSRKPSCEIKAPFANLRDLDKGHAMSSSFRCFLEAQIYILETYLKSLSTIPRALLWTSWVWRSSIKRAWIRP